MSLSTLKNAGVNATLSAILVLTGIALVSAKITSFPLPVVVFGLILLALGFIFGIRAAYLTFLYYGKGGFF